MATTHFSSELPMLLPPKGAPQIHYIVNTVESEKCGTTEGSKMFGLVKWLWKHFVVNEHQNNTKRVLKSVWINKVLD